ncbi:MAG: YfcE family phosphodiesterase, partial [Syntrophus sp. (in: bacteria)]|nr:YfcE family phosphodiesterase [Syntrophus sp. (in: bacteria)]
GHSHVPLNTIREGVMLFNPGSYRGTYMNPGTIGIMEIDHNDIHFLHLQVT